MRPRQISLTLAVAFLFAVSSVFHGQSPKTTHVPEYTFKVIHVFPHDASAYTQGLVYHDGFLYEGTGLNGQSSLRKVRLESGEVVQRMDLAREYFGEGITLFRNEILQLTWKSQVAFVYNLSDFHFLRQFNYSGEGWGLTTSGNELFMSDGTDEIRVLDGSTFKEKRRIKVQDGQKSITQLNELEFCTGRNLRQCVADEPDCTHLAPHGQGHGMD
jgi:glutamine cyclotransferase